MSSYNPFYIGKAVPPEKLLGRLSDIYYTFDMISNRSHVALHGSDGIGKTSLLQYLASTQGWEFVGYDPSDAFIVYLNCLEIQPFNPSEFWRQILHLLKDKSQGDVLLQSQIDTELKEENLGKVNLRRVLRKIGEQDKFLLLLLDDYDIVLSPNDNYDQATIKTFVDEFRSLAVHSEESNYLTTVVASHRRLNEINQQIQPEGSGSPWYNHYGFHPLKPFSKVEVTAFLDLLPSQWPLSFKEGIREIAGGHPALLQNACFRLYNISRNCQPTDVETFIRDFVSATEHFFRNAWELSTDGEKMSMMLIALSNLEGRLNQKRRYKLDGIDIILSQRDRELRDLEDRGIIQQTKKEGKEVYSFTSSIMEWWVIKEIENSKDETELEKRQKVLANLSRQQTEQIKTITKQIWQNKDVIKSGVGWVGQLVGAFQKGFLNG